jgi:tRNA (adenine-N(1)-)-methyltransferase non-catalytic subunit
MMAMSGSGGFILHTIKVFDDPDATSVSSHRHRATKKLSEQQAESSASQAGASSRTMDDHDYSGDTLMSDVR